MDKHNESGKHKGLPPPSTINRSRREHITSGYLQTDCILQGKTLSVFMNLGNHKGLPLPSNIHHQSSTVPEGNTTRYAAIGYG